MSKDKRGGPREGAGRPRLEKEEQNRRNITISNRLAEKAYKIGCGNVSEGIRKALDEYSE